MSDSKSDTVYAAEIPNLAPFEFNGAVADVFQDMIQRSVPGYPMMLEMIGVLTERYAQPETNCYDLGCSLGASTLQLRRHLPDNCHVIGVDNSAAMVERCRTNIARDHSGASVEILEQDINDVNFENASVVVMNFTLQFLDEKERAPLLKRICDSLQTGGVLILCEKVRFEDSEQQAFLEALHLFFKRFQGYSDLEIAQKRSALENVLVPDSIQEHRDRLKSVGFDVVELVIQCLNFVGLVAVRR